ncbi:hypothetical protein [Methylobacterium sp. NEAU K]|uniref:lipase family protein n=1 Tax=Methylobacterium sp. NEAU K TaxID=3064946 RepID=UPI0027339CFD|nr:hypothetical protein [Methylobacterium sp. NEAU K]MDP4006721.1 hypothetical protein [Methylobacterium sp. NEAU K]
MLIRTADEEWLWNLGRPLYLFANQSRRHPYHEHSVVRSAAAAIVSHLSYCVIDEEERRNVSRATIIPSFTFQLIMRNDLSIDIFSILRAMDFPDPIIVRTKNFVALGLLANSELFVGVRGTVGAYDWLINLSCWPRASKILDLPTYFHGGFLSEAEALVDVLRQEISTRRARVDKIIYAGHSLGGAIAAILHQARSTVAEGSPIDGDSYIFGAPRTAWRFAGDFIAQPFAARRAEDVVPRVPPSLMGFESFRDQRDLSGEAYTDRGLIDLRPFLIWLDAMAFSKFIEGHSVENYRDEAIKTASQHPDVSRYIQQNLLYFCR